MKNILVPIGSTEKAINTLQYAIDFAEEIDANILVFRAYKVASKAGNMVNMTAIIDRETKLYLRTLVNAVNTRNVDVKLISCKGGIVDSVKTIDQKLGVDLIVVGAKTNSIKQSVFLGSTAGSLVKKSYLPLLAIPEGYVYKPVKTILMAFKSGIIRSNTVLTPLVKLYNKLNPEINTLLVKTVGYKDEDLVLDKGIVELQTKHTVTENATTYQGVLEHFKTHNPDVLCVFRRKRGFFKKLWEKKTILKKEFYTSIPLLILRGK